MYKDVLVRALNLHRDKKSLARTGERWKILQSHRILRMRVLLNVLVVNV